MLLFCGGRAMALTADVLQAGRPITNVLEHRSREGLRRKCKLSAQRSLAEGQRSRRPGVCSSTSGSSPASQHEEAQLRFGGADAAAAVVDQHSAAHDTDAAANVTLHYQTGWQQPSILYSLQGEDWEQSQMHEVASSSGKWKAAHFQLNGGNSAAPLLEFVINDGGSQWDKTLEGGNYIISECGRFSLKDGQVAAVPEEPVLLISDLDDTLIGDDHATAVFKRFWETTAVPRGSRLVYNTGRALDKCLSLFQEKSSVLPPPDELICAVGTKVYSFQKGEWAVDAEHAALLDEDWDLDVVRDAAYAALAAVGRSEMHFRPPEEQNEHKVTCGVSVAALGQVLDCIQASLHVSGVRARLITSGTGDWRFLDVVAQNAGKAEAMEHVRRKLGFPAATTVACGDSGNDIAMFEGAARGIIVGNAQTELLEWLESSGADRHRVLLTKESRAQGILEGLATFGLL